MPAAAIGRMLRGAISAKIRETLREEDMAPQLDPEHATGFLLANVGGSKLGSQKFPCQVGYKTTTLDLKQARARRAGNFYTRKNNFYLGKTYSIIERMETNSTTQGHAFRGRGRPREFDLDEALDKAAQVFCERGYYATSISDLTSGMGLASGSVYKAFKDKRAVFLATFDRYIAVRDALLKAAIHQGNSGRECLQRVVDFYSAASQGPEGQRGCLVINCAAELATFDAEIALRVTTSLNRSEALLTELICQGQTDGSIPVSIDSQSTARLMLCLLQGMRIVGKTGRSKNEMQAVADMALKLLV